LLHLLSVKKFLHGTTIGKHSPTTENSCIAIARQLQIRMADENQTTDPVLITFHRTKQPRRLQHMDNQRGESFPQSPDSSLNLENPLPPKNYYSRANPQNYPNPAPLSAHTLELNERTTPD